MQNARIFRTLKNIGSISTQRRLPRGPTNRQYLDPTEVPRGPTNYLGGFTFS